ncbi:MAG TPA: EF-P beta-lysylation protein EpmB [Sedimenticola sp.]|nr:EF-P beta-lysylation protein EpmB [Sedimenticola sp.]
MIPRSANPCQTPSWRSALGDAFVCPEALIDYLELDRSLLPGARTAAARFGLRVPRTYAARMEKGNPRDPLLLQVLPMGAELEHHPGFGTDPVGDLAAVTSPGLLHKYQGRALLIATGACAVNCRYCFRRHFPYQDAAGGSQRWRGALDYLRREPGIREIILSGGDPLMMADARLAELIRALETIPHLARLRIHTRMPVIVPERVTDGLLASLKNTRLRPVIVIHCNHANELSGEVHRPLQRLRDAGGTLLNQSVLLKGINDSPEAQIALCESLFETGVLPYYLHLLDPVQGAAHFEVRREDAIELHQRLRRRLPGYLVPRLVQELAGAPAKMPL